MKCNTGYKVVGTGFLVCLESGLWGAESQCVIRGIHLLILLHFVSCEILPYIRKSPKYVIQGFG